MNTKPVPFLNVAFISISLTVALTSTVGAQTIPGPADVGRIKPGEMTGVPERSLRDRQITVPLMRPTMPVPEGASAVQFMLKGIALEGVTAFPPRHFDDIYAPYLNREITLDIAYTMAGAITERYRNAGYFLSLAYVPDQSITDGVLRLRVIEGAITEVKLPQEVREYRVVQRLIDRLTAQKPVTSDQVESFLLRLNDLPGLAFRAVLTPLDQATDGAIALTLQPSEKDSTGSLTFDNHSSRYLGPNELSASYATSLLPLQQTTFSGLASLPADELLYGSLDHAWVVAPDLTLKLSGSVTNTEPGFTLSPFEIESIATSESISLSYQWIRQRQENLALELMLESRDVESDTLGSPLTRDQIRMVRAGASYDTSDDWNGYNIARMTVTQGVDALGASGTTDLNLSRSGAKPDFSKAELYLSRLQHLTPTWSLLTAIAGQVASGVLYSSEQFGYGGPAFGRAYDASEITGDHGVAASLELRYGGWTASQPLGLQPYAFYDLGTVWNDGTDQPNRASAASAGLGVRFVTPWQQAGNLGVAWPLTRELNAPIYGSNAQGPRLLLQFGQQF